LIASEYELATNLSSSAENAGTLVFLTSHFRVECLLSALKDTINKWRLSLLLGSFVRHDRRVNIHNLSWIPQSAGLTAGFRILAPALLLKILGVLWLPVML
jgi:hypothetical protein